VLQIESAQDLSLLYDAFSEEDNEVSKPIISLESLSSSQKSNATQPQAFF
jgi:hypothetical protein